MKRKSPKKEVVSKGNVKNTPAYRRLRRRLIDVVKLHAESRYATTVKAAQEWLKELQP